MTALEEEQALFWRAITWPSGVADFLAHAADDTRSRFAQTFLESPNFSRVQRLDVYADAYFYRLCGALREMFPRLAALAGDARFHNLITDYLLACPPVEPDLRRAGDRLPEFLRAHALSADLPMASDVARVEGALDRALDAPDDPGVDRQSLARVAPEAWPGLTFSLARSVSLVESAWDFAALVRQLDAGEHAAARLLPCEPTPVCFLVGRRAYAPYARRLDALESVALCAVARGASFGVVCDALERESVAFKAEHVVAYLGRWLDDGVVGKLA
jgi:hypothetical protein